MYTRYRGYVLHGKATHPGWEIFIRPFRPDVPILSRGDVHAPTLYEAIAQAETRIDRLLSQDLVA